MSVHIFETESSIWSLDDISMMAVRLPRNETPDHPFLPYQKVGKPAEFTYAHAVKYFGYDRVCIHYKEHPAGRPYPYWALTGELASLDPLFNIGIEEDCNHKS